MPSWKRVIVSGSDASLANVTALTVSSSFSGSFSGNGSGLTNIVSSSHAISASWAPGGTSLVDGATYQITSSWAVSASYFSGQSYSTYTQATASATWSFQHNLNYKYPVITVYNSDDEVVIPEKIYASSSALSVIYFPVSMSGYAAATVGSILPTALVTSASYALTASYAMNSNGGSSIIPIGARIQIDDSYIPAGSYGFRHIPSAGSIIKVRSYSPVTGSIAVNIKRNSTILGTISISNSTGSIDYALSGWTTALLADDMLEFYVSGSSTYITDVSLFIDIQT